MLILLHDYEGVKVYFVILFLSSAEARFKNSSILMASALRLGSMEQLSKALVISSLS
jgi:hypothetical protein